MTLNGAAAPAYERFRPFSASTTYEAAGKTGDMTAAIRSISPRCRIVGRAYTVRCWQGDGSAFTRAVDLAEPGDVLVIDSGVGDRATCWGGTSTIVAVRRGLAGVITNGLVRDVSEIRDAGFPVFCAGTSVRGGLRNSRGDLQVTITVGDVVVSPGDLIVADDDGVVVVSLTMLDATFEGAKLRHLQDEDRDRRARSGESYCSVTGFVA